MIIYDLDLRSMLSFPTVPVTALISCAAQTKTKEVTRRLNMGWFGTRTSTPAAIIKGEKAVRNKLAI